MHGEPLRPQAKPVRELKSPRRPVPKLRKTERAVLIRACDLAFARLVKERAGNRCEFHVQPRYCQGPLDCAHGEVRSRIGTRWSRANAWCLCRVAHEFFHANPDAWEHWRLRAWLGIDGLAYVRRQAAAGLKHDLVDILSELRHGRFLQGDRA